MLVELHRPKVVKKEWERLNSAWNVETDFFVWELWLGESVHWHSIH